MMLFPSGKVELDFYRLYNDNFHIDDPLLNYVGQVYFLYLLTRSDQEKNRKVAVNQALRRHFATYLPLFERVTESQRKSPDVSLLDYRCRSNLLENFRKSYINRSGHLIGQPVEITQLVCKLLSRTDGQVIYNPHAGTGYFAKELEENEVIAVEENALLRAVFMMEAIILGTDPSDQLQKPDADPFFEADKAGVLISTLTDPLFWNDSNAYRHFFRELVQKCTSAPEFKAILLVPEHFLLEERYRVFRNSLIPYVTMEMALPREVMYLTGKGLVLLSISGHADKYTFDFVDARTCIKISADSIVLDLEQVGELMFRASSREKSPAEGIQALSLPQRNKYYNGQPVSLRDVLVRIEPFSVALDNIRKEKAHVMSMDMDQGGLHQDSITAGIPDRYKAIDRPAILISRYLGNGLNISAYQEDERGILFFAEDLILAYSFDEENWDSAYLVREISRLGFGKNGAIILDERELLTASIIYRPLEEQGKSSDAYLAPHVSETSSVPLRSQEEENCQIAFRNITDAFSNYDQYASLLVQEALDCPELEQTARQLAGHMDRFRSLFGYYMTHLAFGTAETLDEQQVEKIFNSPGGELVMRFTSLDAKEQKIDGTVSRKSCLFVAARDLQFLREAVCCLAAGSGKVDVLYGHGPDERHLALKFRFDLAAGKPAPDMESLLRTPYGWYIKRFSEHYAGYCEVRNEGKVTDIIIVLPIRFE